MDRVDELLAGMRAFQTKITLDGSGVRGTLLEEAISRDRRILFYLNNFSMMPVYDMLGRLKVVVDVGYANTDVPISDVHSITEGVEVGRLLARYIGDYKRRLIIIAPNSLNVPAIYNEFVENKGPFYPNFTQAEMSFASFSIQPYSAYNIEVKYRIGKVKLAMMEQDMDREVDRLAALLFLPGMPEETKAYLAHNYLCHTVRYVDKDSASNLERSYLQSAYGALIKHGCVCQGYAEAFKRLMDVAGVDCDVVPGSTERERDADHAWNIIKLHGGRDNYHVDVTWDAADPSFISYTYFGVSDADFAPTREWNRRTNARCDSRVSLLASAKKYINENRAMLLRRGIPSAVLGY